jgi:hypothetical protein
MIARRGRALLDDAANWDGLELPGQACRDRPATRSACFSATAVVAANRDESQR